LRTKLLHFRYKDLRVRGNNMIMREKRQIFYTLACRKLSTFCA